MTPKALEALVLLLRAAPNALESEDLRNALWPDVVVEENALANLIYQLRRALGNDAQYIRTIPKFGYVMNVEVRKTLGGEVVPEAAGPAKVRRQPHWALATALILLLLAGVSLGAWTYSRWSTRKEARELTRDAIHLMRLRDARRLNEAGEKLRSALLKDPSNALAHAGLAEFSARVPNGPPRYSRELAERAVQLDPNCGECRAVLGWIAMVKAWEWRIAQENLAEAIRLEPGNPRAHLWHAQLLTVTGKLDAAKRAIERARELAPTDDSVLTMKAGVLYALGDLDGALGSAKRAAALNPASPGPYDWIYRVEALRGNHRNAIEARLQGVARSLGMSPDGEYALKIREQQAYDQGGPTAVLRNWLYASNEQPIRQNFAYDRATWLMWLGNHAGALEELQRAAESRPFLMIYVAVDPMFAPLRRDSAFSAILKSIGLA